MAIIYANSMDHYGEDEAPAFFNSFTDMGWAWQKGFLIGDGWLGDASIGGTNDNKPAGAYRIAKPEWGARQGDFALIADRVRNLDELFGGIGVKYNGAESMRMVVPNGASDRLLLHFAFSISDLPADSRAHGQILHFMGAAPPDPFQGVRFRLAVDASGRLIIMDGTPFETTSDEPAGVARPSVLLASAGPVIQAKTWYSISLDVTVNVDSTYDINVYVGDILPSSLVISAFNVAVSFPGDLSIVGWLPASATASFFEGPFVDDNTQRAIRDIVFFDTTGTENNALPGQIFVSAQAMRGERDEGLNWSKEPRENIGPGILDHSTNRTGLKFDSSASLDLGAGDFTLESFIRFNTLPSSAEVMDLFTRWRDAAGKRSYKLIYDGTVDTLKWIVSTTGSDEIIAKAVPWFPVTGHWYHVAVVREAGQIKFFIDGKQLGVPIADANAYFASTEPFGVGVSFDTTGAPLTTGTFDGWMDETRLTVGVARYAADFMPTTVPFGRDIGTDASFNSVMLLLGYDDTAIVDESSLNRTITFGTPAVVSNIPRDGDFSFQVLNQRPPWDDTFVEAALLPATGLYTFTGLPLAGETITLDTQTYTWVSAFSGTPANEVLIGATIADSISNFIAAVNEDAGKGVIYGTGTSANTTVAAIDFLSPQFKVQAVTPGAAGNTIATTDTVSAGSFDSATLTGGQDIPPPSDFLIQRLPLEVTGVLGVQMTARAFKTDAGSATLRFDLIGPQQNVALGTDTNVDLNPAWVRQIFETDPDTAAGITPSTLVTGRIRFGRTS